MQQLTGQDASFLYFETANAPMHIGSVAIYDPSTTGREVQGFKDILQYTKERLHLARCFRQRIVTVPFGLDHPWWIEDPNFDLEYHIRHVALPKPGDWRQLCILTARLIARPLNRNHPLWEYYVVEGLDNVEGLPSGCYAIITKIHHAAIDGMSGSEMTAALHDLEPIPGPVPTPNQPWVPDRFPTDGELMLRAGFNNSASPLRLAQLMRDTVPAVARVARGLRDKELTPPTAPSEVPRTRFNKAVSPHRVVDGVDFALDDFKTIKNAVPDATINDAVLAVVGGAMRKYLAHHDELPDNPLIAMAPVSVRSDNDKKAMGNQVAAMMVSLGSDKEDPLDRLAACHDSAVASKKLTNALGAELMTDYSQFIPASTAGMAARMWTRMQLANNVAAPFNCVVTNVPGPQFPLYSAGAQLVRQIGYGPVLDGMGLIHPVFSYCGRISIAFTSCRQMMPDPATYAQCLQESFDELFEAAKTGAQVAAE